jgi:predicted exporter
MTWIALAVVLACGAYAALNLRVHSGITQFAIEPGDARLGPWIGRLAVTEPARTMVVAIAGPIDDARAAARRFADDLAAHPEVEAIRTGPDPALGERLFTALHPRRFRFVDRDPAAVAGHFTPAGLAAAATRLQAELARPTGAGIKRLAPTDPWLLFLDRTAALRAGLGDAVRVEGGQFVTADATHAIVLLTTRHGPFEGAHQGPLDDAIEAEVAALQRELGVVVERSALHRIAVRSERTIRAEVQVLSIASSLGVVVMLLVAFARLRVLLLAMVPMLAGVVVATAVTLAISGRIHGLTLAFGTTLVGVCVDYPVHLVTHHVLGRDRDQALAMVWPALVLGALTTVAGFAALAVFGLPGVREMGLFAAVGVAVALMATRWLVAPLLPTPRRIGLAHVSAAALDRALDWLAAHRRPVAAIFGVAMLAALSGLTRLQWVDDARALNSALPEISEEDARVRALVGGNEVGRVLIAEGATIDDAAAVQDAVWRRTPGTTARSSAPILWSVAAQDANLAAVRAIPELAARTRDALVDAGFRAEAFAALDARGADDPGPLDRAAIIAAGLDDLVRPYVFESKDGVALLSFVGDADAEALAAAVEGIPGAAYFDQRAFTERLYREHRRGSLFAVALGLVVIVGVLAIRYRRPALVAAALVPAVLAAAATLGILAHAGVQLQLLHLVACMLVLAMGVDYGVFLVETQHVRAGRGTAAAGVAIACATTVLAFGVLGTSSNPALAALGITTALGVALAALGAPLSLVLAGGSPGRGDSWPEAGPRDAAAP